MDCLNAACSFCGLPYEGPGLPEPGTCMSREGCVLAFGAALISLLQRLTSLRHRLPDAAHAACLSMLPPANSTVTSYTLYKEGCPSGYGAFKQS